MHTPVFSGHLVCWVHFRRNGQGGNSTTWKRLYPVHCTYMYYVCVPSWWCAIYHKLTPTLEVIIMTSPLASLVCTIGASPPPRLQHILIQWIYIYCTCSSHGDIAIILSSFACSLDTPFGYTVYFVWYYMYIYSLVVFILATESQRYLLKLINIHMYTNINVDFVCSPWQRFFQTLTSGTKSLRFWAHLLLTSSNNFNQR